MDWSRLEQFQEFDDEDRRMTREVIALFASGALSRAAHVLKGAASNVGAQAMSGLASQTCQALQAWAQAV